MRNRKRGVERFVGEGEKRMKERDIQRMETRLIEQERKRRRGETASDDATGEGVKARQHRERGFRGREKPGRGAVEERETKPRGPKIEKR